MKNIYNKIKEKFKYLWSKAFVRDVVILQFGSLFSTGLSFIASLVFARLLGASNYGIYKIVFAFTGLVGTFMDVGANYAAITLLAEAYAEKNAKKIKDILTYFIRFTLGLSFISGGIGIIFAPYFTGLLYNNPQIGIYARVILGATIISTIFSMLTIILQSTRRIASLTLCENFNRLAYKFLPVVFVLFGMGIFGIVFGHFVAAAIFLVVSVIYYQRLCREDSLLPTFREIFFNKDFGRDWQYLKFGFLISVDKNLSDWYDRFPILFLGMFVASAEVGYFGLALSYMSIPLVFIGPISRMLNVQLPKSNIIDKKLLKKHFIETSIYSFLIALAVVPPFILLAPFLVRFFYGDKYTPVIQISYYLSIYVIISALGVGIAPIFRTFKKIKVTIIINAIIVFLGLPVIYWLIKNYGINGIIITYIFWNNLNMFIAFFYAVKMLNKEIAKEAV